MSLVIEGLKKSFGKRILFDKLNLSFAKCGLYAILGKSGIGKTTLLRMISGLDTKFQGKIIGGGAKNVSYCFQEYRLFPQLNALENVIFANHDKLSAQAVEKSSQLLKELGFSERELSLYPHELSGGMKQRVSIARALLKECPVLLLDEPTKELNSELVDTVLDKIKTLANERLVIIVTHNKSDVEKLGAAVVDLDKYCTNI